MSSELCIIDSLLSNPFSRRTIQEKADIIKKGRPRPALPDLKRQHKEKVREYVRSFSTAQYNSTHWLTGSTKLNKLFCWPCLLFSTDNGVWCKTGFDNLNTLTLSITRHEKSANHMKCFLHLNRFARTRIDSQLDEQKPFSDLLHNEKVNRNREVLKRLIDAVCYLATQELPFCGDDESSTSTNRGNYIELLHLIGEYDPLLATHLKDSNIFRGTSSAIQNDLIASITSLVVKKIKEEIEQTNFVAIMLDETSDIINKSQLSTVLRYTDENCEIQERFIGFVDVSRDRTAGALFKHVCVIVKEFECEKKIVAQTYDGATVLADHVNGLNKLVQEQYPCAKFVHCYSHLLNLTLQQSASKIKSCTVFFHTMSGLAAFFSKSSKRAAALKDFVHKKFPTVAPPRWNFTSCLVNTVKEYYDILVEFFQQVLDTSGEWDGDTLLKAQGFLSFLQDFNTRFLLAVFSKIFSFSDTVFDILQTKGLNISCAKKVEDLSLNIQSMRDEDFTSMYDNIETESNACGRNPCSKRCPISDEPEKLKYKCLFNEILDNILFQITERFRSIDNVVFFSLLDSDLFEKHRIEFPESDFISLEKTYGSFFDIVRLKTELSVMYSSSEFKGKSVTDLMQFMHTYKLYMGMPEVFKLMKLVATIPATTSSAQCSFSALTRINTYCRSTHGQERLSSLAIFSIEKELLAKIKSQSTFYDQVIEDFVKKSHRLEFVFK